MTAAVIGYLALPRRWDQGQLIKRGKEGSAAVKREAPYDSRDYPYDPAPFLESPLQAYRGRYGNGSKRYRFPKKY
jgi:hypothetical protein